MALLAASLPASTHRESHDKAATMKIEYIHASKFGNGRKVAEEFQRDTAAKGVTTEVRHVRDVDPQTMTPADLYVFSSPGRMGKPIRRMRRFLHKVTLAPGTKYAVLTTEMAPRPDKKTGRMPTEEELARWQRVRPIMNDILQGKGLVPVAEDTVHVTSLKGPLESGWEDKVAGFVNALPVQSTN
jgi:menaquinone-dependent protoporphyrinogen IX oxidase